MTIFLRKFNKKDINYIYNLRNEPGSRKKFLNKKKIKFKEHKKWFIKKLKDLNSIILVAYNNKYEKVGIIRYDINEVCAKISIIIEKKFRNNGYGYSVIKKSERFLKKKLILISKIKKNNLPSLKVFRKNKYKFFLKNKFIYLIKVLKK